MGYSLYKSDTGKFQKFVEKNDLATFVQACEKFFEAYSSKDSKFEKEFFSGKEKWLVQPSMGYPIDAAEWFEIILLVSKIADDTDLFSNTSPLISDSNLSANDANNLLRAIFEQDKIMGYLEHPLKREYKMSLDEVYQTMEDLWDYVVPEDLRG